MIADALGVTEAAVYHQFNTKEAIVVAVTEVELSRLQDTLDDAEAQGDPDRAREVLLTNVIDMAVERRRWVRAIEGDPWIIRLLGEYEPFVQLMTRVYAMLIGEEAGPRVAVRTAILSAAIGGAVVHPLVADLDDAPCGPSSSSSPDTCSNYRLDALRRRFFQRVVSDTGPRSFVSTR